MYSYLDQDLYNQKYYDGLSDPATNPYLCGSPQQYMINPFQYNMPNKNNNYGPSTSLSGHFYYSDYQGGLFGNIYGNNPLFAGTSIADQNPLNKDLKKNKEKNSKKKEENTYFDIEQKFDTDDKDELMKYIIEEDKLSVSFDTCENEGNNIEKIKNNTINISKESDYDYIFENSYQLRMKSKIEPNQVIDVYGDFIFEIVNDMFNNEFLAGKITGMIIDYNKYKTDKLYNLIVNDKNYLKILIIESYQTLKNCNIIF